MDERLERKVTLATKTFRAFAEIGMWFMFADFALIIANIVLRRFFGTPIFGTTELIRYLMLSCASFAIIENEWIDGNVSMLVFLEKLTHKARSFMLGIIYTVTTVGVGVISFLLIRQVGLRIEDHHGTSELHLPIWIPALILAACFCVLVVVLVIKTLLYFWMSRTGNTLLFRNFAAVNEGRS
jgi:TRAP-type C4-dicarboxylate transport system permease small subunit